MSNQKIAGALGINNQVIPYEPEKSVVVNTTEVGIDETDDYTLSRSTLRTTIENGANALDELLKVARSSQKARDYEVAAKLMDSLAGITKNLKGLHEKPADKRVNNYDSEQAGGPTINIDKAVFTGTTSELLKVVKTAVIEEKGKNGDDKSGV